MKIHLTPNDIKELNSFMLLHSLIAKKQKLMSFYMIPAEFILLGLGIDFLIKTTPICLVVSIILSGIWLYFFPKLYKKNVKKHLLENARSEIKPLDMIFELKDNNIFFYEENSNIKDKFNLKYLSAIVSFRNVYILVFNKKIHIVLPKDDKNIQEEVKRISKLTNIAIS